MTAPITFSSMARRRMAPNRCVMPTANRSPDYRRRSPIIIAAARAAHALNHVAVVGLGVGAMSCYRQPGEAWTFYELDPLVVRIATDRRLFRSFSTCAPHAPVVLGDARLTLKTAPRGTDLLILDAFTSDSV